MKQIIFIFMSLLCFSCSSKAQNQTADTNVQSDKKILVAYFSCTGTTEKAADAIAKTVGGKLYQIMTTENSRPELGGEALNLKDYDVIFLGYPIWWNLCPRPVNTFLEKYDFSGKTVIPFATSGGSSITNSVKQLKKLYPKIVWGESRLLNGSVKQAGDWAKGVI